MIKTDVSIHCFRGGAFLESISTISSLSTTLTISSSTYVMEQSIISGLAPHMGGVDPEEWWTEFVSLQDQSIPPVKSLTENWNELYESEGITSSALDASDSLLRMTDPSLYMGYSGILSNESHPLRQHETEDHPGMGPFSPPLTLVSADLPLFESQVGSHAMPISETANPKNAPRGITQPYPSRSASISSHLAADQHPYYREALEISKWMVSLKESLPCGSFSVTSTPKSMSSLMMLSGTDDVFDGVYTAEIE